MTKRNQDHTTALRATADAAVASWRELDAIAKTKRTACNLFKPAKPFDYPNPRSSPDLLRATELEREALEAEDAADRTSHAAVAALDAAELAEHDDGALARDPRTLHADFVAFDVESTALYEKIADVQRRREQRAKDALQADAEHAARRQAAMLPQSPPLPKSMVLGHHVQRLVEHIERGTPVPSKAAAIANARAVEERICADLEEGRLEDEAIAREKAVLAANKEWEANEANKRMEAQAKERRDANAAEAARREKLAADYKARQAGAPQ